MNPSPRAKEQLLKFCSFSFLMVGLLLVGWSTLHTIHYPDLEDEITPLFKWGVGGVGLVWFLLSLLLSSPLREKIAKRFQKLLLGGLSINATFLMAEFAVYFLLVVGLLTPRDSSLKETFGVFNYPCAGYDPIRGYRWIPGEHRVAKMVNGELIFDQKFKVNNSGYISQRDYSLKKQGGMFRYVVLGDSFTAAEFLEKPWPDQTQEILDREGSQIEIYSFAVDGGGIVNWHRIFFQEIVPAYDFDGMILAIAEDDLSRDFFIMHHEDSAVYSEQFLSIPEGHEDFRENYLPKMKFEKRGAIQSDAAIDKKIKDLASPMQRAAMIPPDLYFLMTLHDKGRNLILNYQYRSYKKGFRVKKEESFRDFFGRDKFEMLSAMIRYSKENGKEMILAVLPSKFDLELYVDREETRNFVQASNMAEHFQLGYYSGIPALIGEGNPGRNPSDYYLKYDWHWSQAGSDLFAEHFAKYLIWKKSSSTALSRP